MTLQRFSFLCHGHSVIRPNGHFTGNKHNFHLLAVPFNTQLNDRNIHRIKRSETTALLRARSDCVVLK